MPLSYWLLHRPLFAVLATALPWLPFRRTLATAYAGRLAGRSARKDGGDAYQELALKLVRVGLVDAARLSEHIDRLLSLPGDTYYRPTLCALLSHLGDAGIDRLVNRLGDADTAVVNSAIANLAKAGGPRGASVLLRLACSNSPYAPYALYWLLDSSDFGLTKDEGYAVRTVWGEKSNAPSAAFLGGYRSRLISASGGKVTLELARRVLHAYACELAFEQHLGSRPAVLKQLGDPMRWYALVQLAAGGKPWSGLPKPLKDAYADLLDVDVDAFVSEVKGFDLDLYVELYTRQLSRAEAFRAMQADRERRAKYPCPKCKGSGIECIRDVAGITRFWREVIHCQKCKGTGLSADAPPIPTSPFLR